MPETEATILRQWIEATSMPNARQLSEFDRFVLWAKLFGVEMPAEGDEIASYLLDLLNDGASRARITAAANSILACYQHHGVALDERPIRAALKIAAAQLRVRTLN